jgi:hypothetical protein
VHGHSQHAVCILGDKFNSAFKYFACIVLDLLSIIVDPALNLVFLHEVSPLILHQHHFHPSVEGSTVLQELCLVFLVDLIVGNQKIYLASSFGDLVSIGPLHEFLVSLPLLLMTCEPIAVGQDLFRAEDHFRLFAQPSEVGVTDVLKVAQGSLPDSETYEFLILFGFHYKYII